MNLHNLLTLLATGALMSAPVLAHEREELDERYTDVTYYGTGHAERAPDFGQLQFTFHVECLGSAEEVKAAIHKASDGLWKEIEEHLAGKNDEKSGPLAGSVEADDGQDGSRLAPKGDNIIRVVACTNAVVPLTQKVKSIYGGTRTFGLRTANLDWLEAKAKEWREKSSTTKDKVAKRKEVQVSVGTIDYQVTRDTRTAIYNEIIAEAREKALGKDSQFETDKKNLRLVDATYKGTQPSGQPFNPGLDISAPVTEDAAPQVRADVPFAFTVFHKTTNSLAKGDVAAEKQKEEGASSTYRVWGQIAGLADYAETTVSITSKCQPSKDAAAKEVESASESVLAVLRTVQPAAKAVTDTDKLTAEPASDPSQDWNNYAVIASRKVKDKPNVPTKYLDGCSLKEVDAPASGNLSELPGYWSSSRTVVLRSSQFKEVRKAITDLRATYGRASDDPTATKVSVGSPVGRLTADREQALTLQARSSAEVCALDPKGQLALDVKANNFKCAHFKSINVAVESRRGRPMMKAAAMESAAFDASPAGVPDIAPVTKPGSERQYYILTRTYAFTYRVMSANYVGDNGEFRATP